jgi:dTDP-4-dehydrorhamnose reductase
MEAEHAAARLLITGGTGWLAQHLVKSLLDDADAGIGWVQQLEIHITYRGSSPPSWIPAHRCHFMDLQEDRDGLERYPSDDMLLTAPSREVEKKVTESSVDAVIAAVRPHILVHCAAVASPAACESNNRFWRVNTPRGIVSAVERHVPNCVVIFTSTDLIYPGNIIHGPARPTDPEFVERPPVSAYGRSKLAFENEILSLPYGIVLRLSNMIGASPPFHSAPPKFLQFLETFLVHRRALDMKNDEFRSFVSVYDVIFVMKSIMSLSISGRKDQNGPIDRSVHPCFEEGGSVYNCGGPDCLSRLDLAIVLAEVTATPVEVSETEGDVKKIILSTVAENDSSEPWRLVSVSSSKIPINVPAAPVVNVDASKTEVDFSMKFSTMRQVLVKLYQNGDKKQFLSIL